MKHLGDFSANRRLLLLCLISLLIGMCGAAAAYVLLNLIALATNLFYFQTISLVPHSPSQHHLGNWSILVPVLGALIIGLMARFGSERIRGHGIPEALEAIMFKKSLMQPKVAVLKPLSSAISIGSGGPFGAEGPIIMTGGACGSLIAQTFALTAAERKSLLVAGAAAGMSATFGSPVAAVLLAVELLLFEWKPRSLIPVAIASCVAATLRPFLIGSEPFIPLTTGVEFTGAKVMLVAVAVGIIAGFLSTLLSRMVYAAEDTFHKLPIHWMWWPAIGGLVIGIGGLIEPRALGIGFDVVGEFVNAQPALSSIFMLLIVKTIVWAVALGSGTSGGVLAPLLIIGSGVGAIEFSLLGGAYGFVPLLSMAAVMGGMMRAPLTATIFAIELTQNVSPMLALLIATICSAAVTVLIMKRSILTEKIARRGFHITREYSTDILERTCVSEIMTKDVIVVSHDLSLQALLGTYFDGTKKHRGYPVVSSTTSEIVGIVTASDVIGLASDAKEGIEVKDVMTQDVSVAFFEETCRQAADKMVRLGLGRLPVVKRSNPLKIVGIISRSDLLKPSKHVLDEEEQHERFLLNSKRAQRT